MKYKLEDICNRIYSGGTPSTTHKEYWNGDLPWLSSGETSQRFVYTTEKFITKEGVQKSSTKYAKRNSIVMASAGQGHTRGQVSFLMNDMYINQSVLVFEPEVSIVNPLYLYYNLDGRYEELRQLSDGTSTRGSLSGRIVKGMEIDLPNLSVQGKIVSVLYDIDKKIENNNQINRNLSEQASAYYENWIMSLTGEEVELSKVIDVRDGTHASPKPQDEGYPLVTSKHLFEYDVDLESPNKISQDDYDKINERSKVAYHDVLMSMIGTVGFVSFISRQEINFAIKNVALFRTSQREELAYYFLLFLKSKDAQQYIKSCMAGSTQQYISLSELRKIPIIVPGKEIKEFNLVVKPIIDMICANVRENGQLSELRDTLLTKLMSGELDVSNLDI